MKASQLHRVLFILAASLIVACSPLYVRAQSYNLTKEVLAKKGEIVWRSVPASAIPGDVCNMFDACASSIKVIALPASTEGGLPVRRGLFLTQDQKHADVIILEHDNASDRYYFLISPEGTLAKTAYAQSTSTSWVPMGNSLATPTFAKDKAAWQKQVAKLGGAPAAAAEKKPDAAQ